jgi:hypothetical protein
MGDRLCSIVKSNHIFGPRLIFFFLSLVVWFGAAN